VVVLAAVGVALAAAFALRASRAEEPGGGAFTPTDRPTLVELGSDQCTSCRAMIPVLEELRSAHACSLEVRFAAVWQAPEAAKPFAVKVIPTQVLLAPDGQEIARHTGFWPADAIRGAFAAHGHVLVDGPECDP